MRKQVYFIGLVERNYFTNWAQRYQPLRLTANDSYLTRLTSEFIAVILEGLL